MVVKLAMMHGLETVALTTRQEADLKMSRGGYLGQKNLKMELPGRGKTETRRGEDGMQRI